MIYVIVERDAGDKQAPDVQSSLITTVEAALARGTQELSYNISDREMISAAGRYLGMERARGIVNLTTVRDGARRGVLRRHSIVMQRNDESNFTATSNILIEVEKE